MTPDRLRRVARRSAGWFGAAIVLVLASLPAIFDLKSLLVALAGVCAAFGLVTAAFTWFDKPPPTA